MECPRINGSVLTEARYVSLPQSVVTSSGDNRVYSLKDTILTVPKLLPWQSFLVCCSFLIFFNYTGSTMISWLVCRVDSRAYLREYDVVGAR